MTPQIRCCWIGAGSHHPDPAAVRTDPGRTVGQPPFVFLKAVIADLETAGAVPAEGQLAPATMAGKALLSSASFGVGGSGVGHGGMVREGGASLAGLLAAPSGRASNRLPGTEKRG